MTKEYDVHLNGNIKLSFDAKNNIESIESKSKLPESVIPSKIGDYIKANYPNNYIIEWELDKTHQEIKLDNELNLNSHSKENL